MQFQVGDIVKTYKTYKNRGTTRFFGVIVRILEESAYPYEVRWLNPTEREYPIAYFKAEQLLKVS